jgi:hypothetical protein
MKRSMLIVTVFLAVPVLAQSAFDGTWKMNPQSAQFQSHDKFLLQNGSWHCETCVPKIAVKADGNPQKVSGSPYYDMITVREVNDHVVEITRTKDSKVVNTEKLTASDDGKELSTEFSFTSEGGQQGNGKGVYQRTAAAPAGANKVSGTWKPAKFESASDSMTTFTFKTTEDGISMSDGTGDSYDAKFDGKDYPYKGDPGTTSVVLKKIDANTIEETDKRNGKVTTVTRMTVASDGKSMKMATQDKLRNSTYSSTAEKQ